VKVLFVCVGNSCRSQMAEGFARALGSGVLEPSSAGTAPASSVSSGAMRVMAEAGIDLGGGRPKPLDCTGVGEFDLVVLMGDEVVPMCPPGHFTRTVRWGIEDPHGGKVEEYRTARDIIGEKVRQLIDDVRSGLTEKAPGGDG
jgi:arsenate reductase